MPANKKDMKRVTFDLPKAHYRQLAEEAKNLGPSIGISHVIRVLIRKHIEGGSDETNR